MAHSRIILEPGKRGLPQTDNVEEYAVAVAKLIREDSFIKGKATAGELRVRFQGQEGCVRLTSATKGQRRKTDSLLPSWVEKAA